MARRSRDELERDRAAALAALTEAGTPQLTASAMLARVLGFPTWDALLQGWRGELVQPLRDARNDVRWLVRHGQLVERTDPVTGQWVVRLATPELLDADDDQREVARMMAKWEPAE